MLLEFIFTINISNILKKDLMGLDEKRERIKFQVF